MAAAVFPGMSPGAGSRIRAGALCLAGFLLGCAVTPSGEGRVSYDDILRLAGTYLAMGDREKGAAVLREAVRREGKRPEAHALLGDLAARDLRWDEAVREYGLAVKGREDPVVLNNLAWAQLRQGKPRRALKSVERALALDPAPRTAYLDTRARVFQALERGDEAEKDVLEALSLLPASVPSAERTELERLLRDIRGGAGEGP